MSRNMDRDWEEVPQIGVSKIEQPSMFIAGAKDPVIAFTSADSMKPSPISNSHLKETRIMAGFMIIWASH